MAKGHRRSDSGPKGSFFLLGPRGSGKSTWIRNAFPQGHRVDLLDEACRGDRRQKTADGIDILPVAAFLALLEGQSLFP